MRRFGVHGQRLIDVDRSGNDIDPCGQRPQSSADCVLPRERGDRGHVTGLPADVQAQSARRLRIVAVLYAFVFFVSDPFTAFLFTDDRAVFLSSIQQWGPSVLSIAAALVVAAVTGSKRLRVGTVFAVGVWFKVAGSFGIAAAQYLDVAGYTVAPPPAGLSWVAVWILGFTVMVPTSPRWALAAALGSASAVVVGFVVVTA